MRRVTLEVQSQGEADAVRRAWADPATRALFVVLGALLELPTDRARRRVLTWATDKFDEDPGVVVRAVPEAHQAEAHQAEGGSCPGD